MRIGAQEIKRVDVRVVAATNKDLSERVGAGAFREDLYYRLHVFPISLPPLRMRTDDIPQLAHFFIDKYSQRFNKHFPSIADETMQALTRYHWPGNVRELQHSIERAVIMSDSESLQPDDFILASKVDKVGEIEIDSFNLDDIEKNIIIQ